MFDNERRQATRWFKDRRRADGLFPLLDVSQLTEVICHVKRLSKKSAVDCLRHKP